MSTGTARVLSVESLVLFRARLCKFGEDVKDTLSAVEMQIHRVFAWLDDRAKHWHREIKVRQEELVRAKLELQTRKIMCKDGRGPGTTDQEKSLRKAQARLKEAEDKAAACKRWHPLLQHAIHEYHGPARILSSSMDIDLKHTLALLAQKIESLEAYLAVAVPSLPLPPSADSSGTTGLECMGFGETAVAIASIAREAAVQAAETPEETSDKETQEPTS
jgi:hypothetical protein